MWVLWVKTNNARILVYDIETAPALGLFFGRPYEVNIAKIIQQEYVFGFAWQFVGEKKVHTCYIWDYPAYTKPMKFTGGNLQAVLDQLNERIVLGSKLVVQKWADLVSGSHILVGHNSDSFDYRQMHGRVMQFKLEPIIKPQQVDTKKLAKRLGYYESNKLDDLSKRYNHGGKLDHEGIEMWWKCMNGDKKAQAHMVKYNKIDVVKTRELYEDFRPYDERHPNVAIITDQPDVCKVCGLNKGFTSAGYKYTTTTKYRYWVCKNCHHKNRGRKSEKIEKSEYV